MAAAPGAPPAATPAASQETKAVSQETRAALDEEEARGGKALFEEAMGEPLLFQLASDLHFEMPLTLAKMAPRLRKAEGCEILCLLGDIGTLKKKKVHSFGVGGCQYRQSGCARLSRVWEGGGLVGWLLVVCRQGQPWSCHPWLVVQCLLNGTVRY